MEKMRDATFDMLKGIGILLVIIGHYIKDRTIRVKNLLTMIGYYSFVIYSFHVIEYVFPDWHQIASFSDGTSLRQFVILTCRLLLCYAFILITNHVTLLRKLYFICK